MMLTTGVGLGLYVRSGHGIGYVLLAVAGFFVPAAIWTVAVYVLTKKETASLDASQPCANKLCSKRVYFSPSPQAWIHADRSLGCTTALLSEAAPSLGSESEAPKS
jgi:hypothetical protein